MPPPLLIDLDRVDVQRVLLSRDEIYERYLPHRHEFMVLDSVCHLDPAGRTIAATVNVSPDAWWVRGHVPGRPLLPGVLMLEMAAQAAALGVKLVDQFEGFIGFGGVDECKFRDAITPPGTLLILAMGSDVRPRRIVSRTQGVFNGRLAFEAIITGVRLR
jgi:3-hydroxyacyl-[acyl-carrier-protein] dehydratase